MSASRIFADFNNLDDANRLRLNCVGTREDLARHGIELQEGLRLTFYMDDANDRGEPDDLLAEGVTHYDHANQCWVAAVDWPTLRHASQESLSLKGGTAPPSVGEMGVNRTSRLS